MIYTGDAWPRFRGNALVCEGAGNLVHRMRLAPDDVAYGPSDREETRVLTSDEVWFRPMQFTNGPDGHLYLADMYRETFEHPDAVPSSAKKYIDITTGNDRGRIYRIVPDRFQQPAPVAWRRCPPSSSSRCLPTPISGTETRPPGCCSSGRPRGRRPAGPACRRLSLPRWDGMHAMYALDGLGALNEAGLLRRLSDEYIRASASMPCDWPRWCWPTSWPFGKDSIG